MSFGALLAVLLCDACRTDKGANPDVSLKAEALIDQLFLLFDHGAWTLPHGCFAVHGSSFLAAASTERFPLSFIFLPGRSSSRSCHCLV